MTSTTKSRREFLKSGGSAIGASWLAVNTPLILAACQSAQTKTETQAGYENLRPEEVVELGAVVEQIIPPDETPGATETGVVYFIDIALGGFMAGSASTLRAGLEELQKMATLVQGRNHRFSDLSFEQQTGVLKEAENTELFGTLHFLTMMMTLPWQHFCRTGQWNSSVRPAQKKSGVNRLKVERSRHTCSVPVEWVMIHLRQWLTGITVPMTYPTCLFAMDPVLSVQVGDNLP